MSRFAAQTARVEIAPSCSMLHVPIDLRMETVLDPDIRSWLAFAAQKTDELLVLAGPYPKAEMLWQAS